MSTKKQETASLTDLDVWLGLTEKENQSTLAPISEKWKSAQKGLNYDLSFVDAARGQILHNIKEQLEKDKTSFFSKVTDVLFRPMFLATSAAFACIVAGIIVFSRTSPLMMELMPVDLAAAKLNSIDISQQAFSAAGQMRAKIKGIDLYFNNVSDFKGNSTTDGVELAFSQGKVYIDYNSGANKDRLIISTPGAKFSVTGTKFMIAAVNGQTLLYVAEGTVLAGLKDSAAIPIVAGNIWKADAPAQSEENSQGVEKAIREMRDLGPAKAETTHPKQNSTTALPEVLLHLTNGQTVRGQLVKETETEIVIRVQVGKGKLVSILRQNIASIDQ